MAYFNSATEKEALKDFINQQLTPVYTRMNNLFSQAAQASSVREIRQDITFIKNELQSKLDRYELKNLRDGITGQNFRTADSEKIESLERRIEKLEKIVEAQREIIEKLRAEPVAQIEPPEKKSINRWIWEFNILETRQVFLEGDAKKIIQKLQIASWEADKLIEALRYLNMSRESGIADNLRRYKIALDKLIGEGMEKFSKMDEELLSGKASEAFFEIVKKNLLETAVISIYRCPENRRETYRQFLKVFNDYLKNCGIYTKQITQGKKITTEIMNISENVMKKSTSKPDEDNVICEVERLPYFLKYYDEDNIRRETFCGANIYVLRYNS